jgi:carbamoyltransferase
VDAAIARAGFHVEGRYDSETDLVARVAALLAEGCVVGWFQGRSEYGPRALGNRSILADPTRRDMQRIVNEKIKFRERFRPFAPAVPVERATEYFDMPPVGRTTAPEYFMLAVHPVRPAYRAVLPAVTHEDGTARVQVVSRDSNRLFYDLLQAFGSLSGIPVLLNTSFNLRGEPIVNSPDDALRTFSLSGMDYLVLHRTILTRRVEF